MKAIEWIERLKTSQGWTSDYRAAKELGLTRQAVSDYRNRVSTMDEETAAKVAAALGIDPAAVIIDQLAERSRNPDISTSLHRVARQLCILC